MAQTPTCRAPKRSVPGAYCCARSVTSRELPKCVVGAGSLYEIVNGVNDPLGVA